jgi:phospholipid transport system substrate-binding protein
MAYLSSPWRILAGCASPAPWTMVTGQPDAEAFVTTAVRDLFRILGDSRLTPSERAGALASIVGRLTGLDPAADLILRACASELPQALGFAGRLGSPIGWAYDGSLWRGSVDVTLLSSHSPRPDEAVVTFTLPDDLAFRPTRVSWRVLRSTGGWRLIDVECRGAWPGAVRRSTSSRRNRE